MYRNPTTGIPESTYFSMLGENNHIPQEKDVIFVRRGSYRIGTVAMVSPRDQRVLLTRELLTFRVKDEANKYGLTPFYLLAMLSSLEVQKQIPNLVYVDTTLPNIGDRWKYLLLPFHSNLEEVKKVSNKIEKVIRKKWEAQILLDQLRDNYGDLVT